MSLKVVKRLDAFSENNCASTQLSYSSGIWRGCFFQLSPAGPNKGASKSSCNSTEICDVLYELNQ